MLDLVLKLSLLFVNILNTSDAIVTDLHEGKSNGSVISNATTETNNLNITTKYYCSSKHLQYCNNYIRNIIILYTKTGGWILLAIVLCGVFFQLLSSLMAMKQRKKPLGRVKRSWSFPRGIRK